MSAIQVQKQAEALLQTYRGLVKLDEQIPVWTPDGTTYAPGWIAAEKSPASRTLPQTMSELGASTPKQMPCTSGEWMQARLHLQNKHPEIEKGMTTGAYEKTATILDYVHGKPSQGGGWFDGLVIQIPLLEGGELAVDEKGIIKGHVYEMALPIKSDYAKNLPKECDVFLNTIHGMESAREQFPEAYVYLEPGLGIINLLRGRWLYGRREYRRVSVLGTRRPLSSDEGVASRGAANGKVVCNFNKAGYAKLNDLLEQAENSTPEEAAALVEQIRSRAESALVWEDI